MKTKSDRTEQATLTIDDMACGGCADTVQKALNEIDGVEQAAADHEKGIAIVTYDRDQVSVDDFEQAVKAAGYTFSGME